VLHRALEQAGLELEDVERVYEGPDESVRALREGERDAVVAYEPYCRRMVAAGGHVLFDSTRIPDEIVDVLVLRRSYLQSNPEQVDMLLRGWFSALAYMRQHPSESARRMAPRVGLDAEDFLGALKGVRHPDASEQRALLTGQPPRLHGTIQRLGSVMTQREVLPEPPAASHLIDAAPLLRISP
jgi:NitT/TauT family transport system substrate-binding protein